MAQANLGAASQQTAWMLQKVNSDVQISENLDMAGDSLFSQAPTEEIGLQQYRHPIEIEVGGIAGYYQPDGGSYFQGQANQVDQMIVAPLPIMVAISATELARRIAKDAGLDLTAVSGTGPHGRIVERDVKAAIAGGGVKAAPAPAAASAPAPQAPRAAAPAAMSDEQVKKFYVPGSYEEIPHDSMRKTIARRLVEAKQTIPHFYLTVDCDLDKLLALREEINKAAPSVDGKPAYKVSVNDFVIKGMALALMRVPDANVTWTEGAMLKHRTADVGVAVSIPGGLITPVVRSAEKKSLSTISNEMKDYAARARARKLKPDEYQGGTSAVSNLGMFGIKHFSAVINPPHATILAVGAGEQRVVVKNGQPAVATVMSVTLSTDHRAVDGALGAELIAAFKQLIENPMSMLV